MAGKKGQVAIFIILGIVLFAIISILFVFQARFRQVITSSEVEDVRTYVQGCLEDALCSVHPLASNAVHGAASEAERNALYENQINLLMISKYGNILSCVDAFKPRVGGDYDLRSGNLENLEVDVLFDKDDIASWSLNANFDVEVVKGLNRQRLNRFTLEVNECA